jgi:DNA-directed RNA polymerase subunit M/transcription elongation factor TFIIS
MNDGHRKLAQKLISLHQTKNPFTYVPEYSYDQLQKGIFCPTCKSFLVSIKNYYLVCEKCGGHEKLETAILRNVEEFKLLFPDRKVTTNSIYEWCRVNLCKKTFSRVLKKNYITCGMKRSTYFK